MNKIRRNNLLNFKAGDPLDPNTTLAPLSSNEALEKLLGQVQNAVASGEAISKDMRIRNRRDQAFAVKLTCQAADALYAAVGGGGLFLSSGVQRAWRDAHAVAKHVSLNWDWVGSMYGQLRLGLEPNGQY